MKPETKGDGDAFRMNPELFQKYVTKILTAEEEDQLRELLERDERVAREFVEFLQTWSITAEVALQLASYNRAQAATAEDNQVVGRPSPLPRDLAPAGWAPSPMAGAEDRRPTIHDQLKGWLELVFSARRTLQWSLACAALIMVGFFFVFRGHVRSDRVVARVVAVEPGVLAEQGNRSVVCSQGMTLGAGVTIRTDGNGTTVIRYPDATELKVKSHSRVTLQPADRAGDSMPYPGKRVLVTMGSLDARVARQPAAHPMIFSTATVQVQVLGTELGITASPSATRVEVREGQVRVTRPSDQTAVTVSSGQYVLAGETTELKTEPLPSSLGGGVREKLLADADLLFYVPFDIAVGADKARNPYGSGRLLGEGEYGPGVVGNCLSLPDAGLEPGQGPVVAYGLAGNLDMRKGSMMLWFKPYWPGTDRARQCTIAWVQMKDDHSYFAWHRSFAPSLPTALYMIKTNAGMYIDTAQHFVKDRWVHLATTWDAQAAEQTVYVNGRRMGSGKWALDPADARTNEPLSLALGKYYAEDQPINGAYDELYILGRALTEDEISGYYHGTMPTPKW